jgi:hypothetical protein
MEATERTRGIPNAVGRIAALSAGARSAISQIREPHLLCWTATSSEVQDTFYVGTLKGVGRINQQTFIDTYPRGTSAKPYDRKHALVTADIPVNDQTTALLQLGEGAFHRPATLVTSQSGAVVVLLPLTARTIGTNQFHLVSGQSFPKLIAVGNLSFGLSAPASKRVQISVAGYSRVIR